MIKAIDHRKIDLTEDEFEYYKKIVNQYTTETQNGADYFSDLFETNDDGIITIIKPIKNIPWSVLFFIQNIMINQRLSVNDKRLDYIEKQLQERK